MGVQHRAVGWNPAKRRYDLVLAAAVGLYLAAFVAAGGLLDPGGTLETRLIRALGSCAFLMLHAVLVIGPLARLDPRWLPLLYNRRHLGVATFAVALCHGAFALLQHHGGADLNPLVSLLSSGGAGADLAPFQLFGAGALAILFLMAATSHDFWLATLTAPVWKALHLSVYLAYGLLVLHVALGSFSEQRGSAPLLGLALGAVAVFGLQLAAAVRERQRERQLAPQAAADAGWVDVGAFDEIPEGRAKLVNLGGERLAVFRDGERLAALSNVCQHQGGPLGEGRVVNGCAVCPWHGYEYRLDDGCSPPPYDEQVPQFRVRAVAGRVQVDPRPRPAGAPLEPTTASPTEDPQP